MGSLRSFFTSQKEHNAAGQGRGNRLLIRDLSLNLKPFSFIVF
jgi:hypothetical protein